MPSVEIYGAARSSPKVVSSGEAVAHPLPSVYRTPLFARETLMLPKDEYLSAKELQSLKELLDQQLEDMMTHSREAVHNLTEVRVNDADPLDLAVTESNRDFTLRLADRERRLVVKIRHSLERMQNGEYGACESCGGAINYSRLLARPVATLCIDCKTEAEQVESRKRVF